MHQQGKIMITTSEAKNEGAYQQLPAPLSKPTLITLRESSQER